VSVVETSNGPTSADLQGCTSDLIAQLPDLRERHGVRTLTAAMADLLAEHLRQEIGRYSLRPVDA